MFYSFKENTYFTYERVISDCDWRLQNLLLRPLRTGFLGWKVRGNAGLLPLTREAPPTQTASCLTVLLRGSSVLISEIRIVGNLQRMRYFLIFTNRLIATSLDFFTHKIGIATFTPGGCRSLIEVTGTGKPSSVGLSPVRTAFSRRGSPSQGLP